MKKMRFPNRVTGLLAGALLAAGPAVSAASFETLIADGADDAGDLFRIAANGQAATIVLSEEDYGPVIRAAKDLSEDVVYEFTKTMFENQADLVAGHAKFGFLDPTVASVGTVPLHPGAEKYYKEIGVL